MDSAVVEANRENIVTKSNTLIEANYKLGVVEQKIILCLASNIQPTDDDFRTYTLPIREFHKMLGLRGTPKYTEIRQITYDLMKKAFEVHIDNQIVQVSWLSYVAYNKEEGTIDIRFDPFLKPYLLELKREFTSYKLENVIRLKSAYAIRIYELLKQYERLKKRTFSLVTLRKAIGADKVYPAYGNFKQRILLPAQKELSQKTDLSFEFKEIKKGRRVDKIEFHINSKNTNPNEQLQLFEESLRGDSKNQFEKARKIALKIGFKLTEKQYNMWAASGHERVQEVLEDVVGKKNIKNPIGYITHILKTTEHRETESAKPDDLLLELLPRLTRSREMHPPWFIERNSIEYLQEAFNVSREEAHDMFSSIKESLYEILGIKEEKSEPIDEEHLQKLLKIQEKYKKKERTVKV